MNVRMAWFSFMWNLAQMKRHFFFLKDPFKIIQKLVFFLLFCIFLLIFVWKLQKIWVSGFRSNLGCAQYAQNWVFLKNFKIQLVKKLQQWSLYEVIELGNISCGILIALQSTPASTAAGEGEGVYHHLPRPCHGPQHGVCIHLLAEGVQVWPDTSIPTSVSCRHTFSHLHLLDILLPGLGAIHVEDEEDLPCIVPGSPGSGPVARHLTHWLIRGRRCLSWTSWYFSLYSFLFQNMID